MLTYTLPDARIIYQGHAFVLDDVQYPANWLQLAAHEDLAGVGITVSNDPDPVPVVTPDDVAAERARRLALGFDYNFGDARGVHHIGTTEADMRNWEEVTSFSQALVALGDTATAINILTNTGSCAVTALEWMQILVAAAAVRQPLFAASFALQAMTPIPTDYADDRWWPA